MMCIRYLGTKNEKCSTCKGVNPTFSILKNGVYYFFIRGIEREVPEEVGRFLLKKYDYFEEIK